MALRVVGIAFFAIDPGLEVAIRISNKSGAPITLRPDKMPPDVPDGLSRVVLSRMAQELTLRILTPILELQVWLDEAETSFAFGVGAANVRQ